MKFNRIQMGQTYWRVSYRKTPTGQTVNIAPVEVSAVSHNNEAVFAVIGDEPARWYFDSVYCKWRENKPEVVLEEDGRTRLRNLEERFGEKHAN